MSAHKCSHCNEWHTQLPLRKEVMNPLKVMLLRRAADHVIKNMDNNFMVREIAEPEEFNKFHNFQKLRYHGLVAPIRDVAGKPMKGQWLVTRNGWAFLRGEIAIHQYVIVRDNHIKDRSAEMVKFRDVAYGEVEVQTKFEYFDDNNNPVGLRPAAPTMPLTQERLL